MFFINIIIVIIALFFYVISFYTPKQEYFFYGVAAVLMLIAGVSGITGYSDVVTGSQVVYNATTNTATVNNIYSNNDIFTKYIPLIEILTALYLFLTLTVIKSNKNE